jgi:hypothetical protein
LKEWDGYDYEGVLRKYDKGIFTGGNYCVGPPTDEATRIQIFQDTLVKSREMLGSEDDFAQRWSAFRGLHHTFLKCDLLFEASRLINKSTSEVALFWFSNIFNYHLTIKAFGTRLVRDRYITMVEEMREYRSRIFCLGEEPLPSRGQVICCVAEEIDLSPFVR